MKVSRDALQRYIAAPLPTTAEIADTFTFHAFEIDAIDGDMLDIKVLPNRAPDCSSEEGMARELASILDLPLISPDLSNSSRTPIETSVREINARLGSAFSIEQIHDVLSRTYCATVVDNEKLTITPPAWREDLTIPEDIAEEVGRIIGYDAIEAVPLPPAQDPVDQNRYRGIERMKDQLVAEGYTEVSTQSFMREGAVHLQNPLDATRPALRENLESGLTDALTRARQYEALLLPPKGTLKLFEVGTVFPANGEYLELRMTEPVLAWGPEAHTSDNLSVAKLEDYGRDYEPVRYEMSMYRPFSVYPFIQRDIALWVPRDTMSEHVEQLIKDAAGVLLTRIDLFDQFEKGERVSLAYRLIFQSLERTLRDDEINEEMQRVSAALTTAGYEVR